MPGRHDPDESDVPEWIVSTAKSLGFNEIRVRWKLIRWQRAWRNLARDLAPASRRFEHQICPNCGAVQDHGAKVCSRCNDGLSASPARWLKKLGLRIPTALSISTLLGVLFVFLYVRMYLSSPGQTLWGWKNETFVTYGGVVPDMVLRKHQWWRLATACFMHLGIFHLGFNTVAIMQIGPTVEELFGRARMLFFFMLTGVLSLGVSVLVSPVPTAGASGAIMGLIGVAAGWGQRDGTTVGREVRNQMVQWGVYTMFFGIMVNANHWAHAGGFVVGALLGYAFDPRQLERSRKSTFSHVLGVVGALALAGTVGIMVFPLRSAREGTLADAEAAIYEDDGELPAMDLEAAASLARSTAEACRLHRDGKDEQAMAYWRRVMELGGEEAELDAQQQAAWLAGTCQWTQSTRDMCAAFQRQGASMFGDPSERKVQYLVAQVQATCEGVASVP